MNEVRTFEMDLHQTAELNFLLILNFTMFFFFIFTIIDEHENNILGIKILNLLGKLVN